MSAAATLAPPTPRIAVPDANDAPAPGLPARGERDAFYAVCRKGLQAVALSAFPFRAHGLGHVPATGGVILASTHQSFLDPMLVSLPLRRPVAPMARRTLFGSGLLRSPLAWLMRKLRAYPVDRDGADAEAVAQTLRLLEAGTAVVIFPEGRRTRTGRIGPVGRGLAVLARRSGAPVVPVVVAGAYECWPPHQPFPIPGRPLHVGYGRPLPPPPPGRAAAQAFGDTLRGAWLALRERLAAAGAPPHPITPEGGAR